MPRQSAPPSAPSQWRNRVVGSATVDVASLQPSPLNWRTHPQFQQDVLRGLIRDVGYVVPVLVSKATNHILDGHLRVEVARQEGQATIPVTYVEVTEDEEQLILSTVDPLAALAEADRGKLKALLDEVQSGESAVQQMLAQLAQEQGLLETLQKHAEPPDEFKEYDENIETEHTCPKCGFEWSGGT